LDILHEVFLDVGTTFDDWCMVHAGECKLVNFWKYVMQL
jgi:hypothetical protein